jgi:putative peptide zinc metalloprotease protein
VDLDAHIDGLDAHRAVEMVAMNEPFLSHSWHRVKMLRPRLRGHIQVHRHRYRGEAWYVAQDDIAGRYHRFTTAAYLFVGQMDGRQSVDDIWARVVSQLGDDAPTQDQIVRLLSELHAADILQCDIPPDASELFNRHSRYERNMRLRRFGNPVAARIRLWDPNSFLDRSAHLIRPWLGRTGAIIWLATVTAGLLMAGVYWPQLSHDAAGRLLVAENLALLVLCFAALKVLHELGHGYAAKLLGAEVHELGIMFLVFVPLPYVDASAVATFRSKWHRAAVGAAGMAVELFIAAIALLVWTIVEPGLIRSLAYNVAFSASISTFIFNANPLLRFDGYYILSDLIEVPNLGSRANRYWGWLVERYLFGLDREVARAARGERLWFLVYAPCAFAYRFFVMFGIALFVAAEYFVVGVIIAIASILMGLVWPIAKSLGHVLTSPRLYERRSRSVAVTFGGIAVLSAALFLAPVPLHTVSEGVIWLPEESLVRAATDGDFKRLLVAPGEGVKAGAALVEIDDPIATAETRILQAQVEAAVARFESEQFTDRVQANLTLQELALRTEALSRGRGKVDQLTVRSMADGTFLVPRSNDLPGRYFKRGDVIGYVTAPRAWIARVVVSQADIDLVRFRFEGASALFAGSLGQAFPARLLREVPGGSDWSPSKALTEIGGGRLNVDPRDPSQTKTLQRTFQFDLGFPDSAPVQFGGRVLVRFSHGLEPLGWQFYRRVRQLLLARFEA